MIVIGRHSGQLVFASGGWETGQGFLTTQYLPEKSSIRVLHAFKISFSLLQDVLYAFMSHFFRVSPSDESVDRADPCRLRRQWVPDHFISSD
ncbi:hypothetical protein PAXRUDRAFT_376908 [Paxillus rubicundulus Ve08.2h10]|uniref:Uncharacterized protein n=1 Tax=Paxillus rubicundulus Ve08.2h10 TaxID=930991 RepID=A0A0D0D1P0_9AGAM|nr:hypothetical protein PAXRUDRAFT_376908 [Paxillus rubicundulus Ve08.2h10]